MRQRIEAGQVAAQGARLLAGSGALLAPQGQLLQHFGAGPAAVVPDPRQPEGVSDAAAALPFEPIALDGHRISIGADRGRHQGQHLGTTAATPAKQAMGEGVGGVPGQLVGAKPAHTSRLGHSGQAGAKAKAVGQPGQAVLPLGETGFAVVLTLLKLTQQGGGGDQHGIGFDPRTIEGLEAAGGHGGLQAFKEGGTLLLQPGVEGRGGMAKVQLCKWLHQCQHRVKGALGGAPGVGHWPKPGQIEVGVAQPMHGTRPSPRAMALLAPQVLQLGHHRLEQPLGILGIEGFEVQVAVNQGPVVMERAD